MFNEIKDAEYLHLMKIYFYEYYFNEVNIMQIDDYVVINKFRVN